MRQGGGKERLAAALDVVGLVLEQDSLRSAAAAVATELATRLGFERVSIGIARGGRTVVEAISNSASFDERTKLVRELAAAMDEASDQDATVVHPALAGRAPRIARAHEELILDSGTGAACTVPLASGGRVVGAITFETCGSALHIDSTRFCEDVAALLGPLLELRDTADQSPLGRLVDLLRAKIARLLGPGHPELKLVAASLVCVLAVLSVARGTYRITADATLEGRVQRAIVAGIEGYVAEANRRAGDLVSRGEILGRLDERDLVLERRKWAAQREQLRQEQREARAQHERTQLSILGARIAGAEAQLDLLNEQLTRAKLVSPFDGIVVRGDLSQSLGSPVEKGQVLFEVAPLEGYRIILKVDERDVREVTAGSRGRLVLSALPGRPLPLTVERVTPVATAEGGRNYFRAEARLDEPADSLRPGMEGVAKIEIDRRRLIWIWTHRLLDWLRLRLWSWLP